MTAWASGVMAAGVLVPMVTGGSILSATSGRSSSMSWFLGVIAGVSLAYIVIFAVTLRWVAGAL